LPHIKTILATTHVERIFEFDLENMCATFDFITKIGPTEEIHVFAIELQCIFEENDREL